MDIQSGDGLLHSFVPVSNGTETESHGELTAGVFKPIPNTTDVKLFERRRHSSTPRLRNKSGNVTDGHIPCQPLNDLAVKEQPSMYRVAVPVMMTSGVSLIQAATAISRRAPRIRRYSGSSCHISEGPARLSTRHESTPVSPLPRNGIDTFATQYATLSKVPLQPLKESVPLWSQPKQLISEAQSGATNQTGSSVTGTTQSTERLLDGLQSLSVVYRGHEMGSSKFPTVKQNRVSLTQTETTTSTLNHNSSCDITTPTQGYLSATEDLTEVIVDEEECATNVRSVELEDMKSLLLSPFHFLLSRVFLHGIASHADAYSLDLCSHILGLCEQSGENLHLQLIDAVMFDSVPSLDVELGSWWRHLLAGGTAGAASRTCTAPLDRLKVMRMVGGSKTCKCNIVGMFRGMLKEGGVQSLWRGNALNVVKVVPETALKFAIYEQIKSLMHARTVSGTGSGRDLNVMERFAAGSCAGLMSQTIIYPLEVLKTSMVLRRTGQYASTVDCARHLFREGGASVFYRGYVPNVLGIIPYAGIDLAVYETLKRLYVTKQGPLLPSGEPSTLVLLGCGLISSSCGQLASYPLSLVRTRLQAQVTLNGTSRHDGLFAQVRYIYRTEGPVGFYRGMAANFLKVAPAVGISYAVYENVRSALGVKMT